MIKEAISTCVILLCMCILLSCVNKDYPTEEVKETNRFIAEELIQQIKEELNELQSVSIESAHIQAIKKGDNNEDTTIQNRFTQYNDSPFVMYQQFETTHSSANASEKLTQVAQYVTKELAYVYNQQSDVWMEVPVELREDLNLHHDPKAELQQYLSIAEEYSHLIKVEEFEETDKEYELKVEGAGMEVRSAVVQSLELSSLINEQQSSDLVNHMEIKELEFIVSVEKKTNMINRMDINIQLAMQHNGDQVDMYLETYLNVQDFNKTELNGIPDDIIENAEEYKMELGNME
ncbi:DUF6612 family protein [Alkalicoccobacillus gibsonii]|uniref:DUF6612 family protein n=1 Tax=Alkalicoccobacillus gibsonii TaxID=79881 RepID=UPI003F7C6EEA